MTKQVFMNEMHIITPKVGNTKWLYGKPTLVMPIFNCENGRRQATNPRFFCNIDSMRMLGRLLKEDSNKYTFEYGDVIKIERNYYGHGISCFTSKKQNKQISSFELHGKDPFVAQLKHEQLKHVQYVIYSSYDPHNPLYSQPKTKLIYLIGDIPTCLI